MKYNEYVIVGVSGVCSDVKDSNQSDNINPRVLKGESHNFVMQTFNEPTRCSCCNRLLRGTFYQGYECTGTERDQAPPVPDRVQNSTGSSVHRALNYKAHRDYNGIPPPPYPNVSIIKFQIGQPIEVTEQVSSEWWKGRSLAAYDKIGFFPASHVSPHSKREPRKMNYMQADIRTPASSPQTGPKSGPVNSQSIEDMAWYAGEIDRAKAEQLLIDKPTGTFLVRKKLPNSFVVSLNFQQDVKHIKVLQTDDHLHYLAECKNFRSVQDLIRFYERNSLSGFFLGLETTLKYPYRNPEMFPDPRANGSLDSRPAPSTGRSFNVIGRAIAKYDFEARSEQELSLVAGQYVNIISKAGGVHGWWKGEYDRKVGYFPTRFVDEHI